MKEIYIRRSIREFLDKDVEPEKVEQIIRAAMQAPSAKNQQPWEFYVVKGKQNLEKLSKFAPYSKPIAGANLAIIVLGNTLNLKSPNYMQHDLGAATQCLLLEATTLGLGTVWNGAGPDNKRMDYLKELYQLPEHLFPFSVIAVGYPKDTNQNYFIDRFSDDKITYINE